VFIARAAATCSDVVGVVVWWTLAEAMLRSRVRADRIFRHERNKNVAIYFRQDK
jgi:hypothetical protein